ncbi:carboxylesterase/lipase family protein [Williamsia sp. 1135]|uniref:carboxylesterase/lipase family protein n=1 Tax=Williamsia sp. 1135 TaxID=1889262 RepID=UPI001F0B2018|nr:carboxylesterase/lipase family protein [Williamsia sp. 1135]
MVSASTKVTLSDGVVEGVRDGDFIRWRGIPYAAPPVGDLRFRSPEPAIPWSGVLAADSFGNAAPQNPKYAVVERGKHQPVSEDSLIINVVAPGRTSEKPRAVMVFIHGGAYILGSTATPLYYGHDLVKRGDVIFVSMNYRLGPLGYGDFSQFSTADRVFESNLGLRDQVKALEWVRDNIADFGGDPGNVTIFGESAGGNAVTTLMATPAAGGLFHRAIAESSAPMLTLHKHYADRWARKLTELLCADMGVDDVVTALTTASLAEMGRAGHRLARWVTKDTPGLLPYGPVVDGDYLPVAPVEAFAEGTAHQVPMIIGTNRNEGTLFKRLPDGMLSTEESISAMFANTEPDAQERITGSYGEKLTSRNMVQFGGDYIFWVGTIAVTQGHSEHAPTYAYRYDFAPRLMKWLGLGATHASELLAVFGVYRGRAGRLLTAVGDRRDALRVTSEMQDQWLSFAKTGEPLESWPRYTPKVRATRIFDRHSYVEVDPWRARREAWSGFGDYAAKIPGAAKATEEMENV